MFLGLLAMLTKMNEDTDPPIKILQASGQGLGAAAVEAQPSADSSHGQRSSSSTGQGSTQATALHEPLRDIESGGCRNQEVQSRYPAAAIVSACNAELLIKLS